MKRFRLNPKQPPLWLIVIPTLIAANLAYGLNNILGWILTLGFFLIVPGFLALRHMKIGKIAKGEYLSLSLGLSLAILIFGGLVLNSLHSLGLERPLETIKIFIFFDVITLFLTFLIRHQKITLTLPKIKVSFEQGLAFAVLTLLPLLAIGGAHRLNNGASNILTLVLMALIAILFVALPWRPNLKPLYPYAVFTIGLSILFCNSLRGWQITGHDIHHELSVFRNTFQHGVWAQAANNGDPYKACLSITILPTIFAKLTTIPVLYIYKVAFQVLFAAFLPALFYTFRRFVSEQKAVLGVFVFMTFPTFTNDLPFLNRQEIALIFIILLLFVNFLNIAYRAKLFLTCAFLVSIILSHYSSSYVTLVLLLISPIFYVFLSRKHKDLEKDREKFPLLRIRIILIALLLTFAWNSQITASTGNLRNTVVDTFTNLFGPVSEREGFTYSLTQAPTPQKPQKIFNDYASQYPNEIHLLPKEQLPITKLGHLMGHISGLHNAQLANEVFHAILAKVLQLLVILGTMLLIFRKRHRADNRMRYLISLACASLFTLTLFTVLPQLAVDYDVTRLFQQSLMFLWLPSILLAELAFFYLGRYRLIAAASLFAFLYLNLVGFIPQLTGGFPPQLPLNNSGVYYNYFYGHGSDVTGTEWLAKHRELGKGIKFDSGAVIPPVPFRYGVGLVESKNTGYLYRDYTDNRRGSYRTIIEGVFIEYTNPSATADRNKVYSNTYSNIYLK